MEDYIVAKKQIINRRVFLKSVGAAGIGSVLASAKTITCPNEPNTIDPNTTKKEIKPKLLQIPKRKLGKTGVKVSSLSIGLMYNTGEKLIVLRNGLTWGLNYWDTADCYAGGNSEIGIGKFFEKNQKQRKDIFLVTKSDDRNSIGIQKLLERSLERMKTDYIDLYYLHSVTKPEELTDEVKEWAEKAKKAKKIKFFGFSTHSNMENCLTAAAKAGWIDAIMTSYNYRLMQEPKMQAAVDACHKAGVGLIAMKTQARGQKFESDEDKKLSDHFLKKGFTDGQAKIKIVLQDKRFSSTCVGMDNIALMMENIAAVLDKTKLSPKDIQALKKHANATCSGYCAGCSEICASLTPDMPYICDIMRYLMYHNSYGDKDRARKLFAKIPKSIRSKLLSTDYTIAQANCPQNLPIAKLIKEAANKLA